MQSPPLTIERHQIEWKAVHAMAQNKLPREIHSKSKSTNATKIPPAIG